MIITNRMFLNIYLQCFKKLLLETVSEHKASVIELTAKKGVKQDPALEMKHYHFSIFEGRAEFENLVLPNEVSCETP